MSENGKCQIKEFELYSATVGCRGWQCEGVEQRDQSLVVRVGSRERVLERDAAGLEENSRGGEEK